MFGAQTASASARRARAVHGDEAATPPNHRSDEQPPRAPSGGAPNGRAARLTVSPLAHSEASLRSASRLACRRSLRSLLAAHFARRLPLVVSLRLTSHSPFAFPRRSLRSPHASRSRGVVQKTAADRLSSVEQSEVLVFHRSAGFKITFEYLRSLCSGLQQTSRSRVAIERPTPRFTILR